MIIRNYGAVPSDHDAGTSGYEIVLPVVHRYLVRGQKVVAIGSPLGMFNSVISFLLTNNYI